MLLFCNGLTYMAQTFRDDSLGQNPTFLLSKCFYFMTPGGAAAFVYFLTKQPVWRCLKDLISNFFGFSESLGKSTLYTLISKWDLSRYSFYKQKRKRNNRKLAFRAFMALWGPSHWTFCNVTKTFFILDNVSYQQVPNLSFSDHKQLRKWTKRDSWWLFWTQKCTK